MLSAWAYRITGALRAAGVHYPIAYAAIADAAMVACLVAIPIEAAVAGVSGWSWVLVAAGILPAAAPMVLLAALPRTPWLHGLMVWQIAAVVVLWILPVHLVLPPLLLVLAGTMLGAVVPPRSLVWDLLAATVVILIGTHLDRLAPNQLYITMLWFGAVVAALLRAQMRLTRQEQQARVTEAALERASIAREVHDVVAHSLSVVLLNVTGARRALADGDTEDASAALGDAEHAGRAAMADIRRTIALLRTDTPGPKAPQPGLADIEELIASLRRAGTTITVDGPGALPSVTAAGGLAAYRIVQESLSNAIRHAPGAPIAMRIATDADRAGTAVVDRAGTAGNTVVHIEITNPLPPGQRRIGEGLGIAGMRARAEQLGGSVIAGTDQEGHWRVSARLPVDTVRDDRAQDDRTQGDRTQDDTESAGVSTVVDASVEGSVEVTRG